MTFVENVDITEVTENGGKLTLKDGKGYEIQTDYAVAAIGRGAAVGSLHLDRVNVTVNRGGIAVNEFLQTSNPKIYALGDVIDKTAGRLTPVSGFEARYLLANWDKQSPEAISYPAIPSIVFGATKLAKVGETTGSSVKEIDTTGWYTYRRVGDPLAKIKLYSNEEGLIVGASILSTLADELVNFLSILINKKISLMEAKSLIMAYPTPASDLTYYY
ncbi:FAD-dependent oxidoreductase [Lactococcus termiticola]|uniref:Glutathione reductase n=1 Tax=Lactococcus termiticola TaxID=2169526 RepID=A0A2R5HKR4_9LACT|nr:FAD-dependent oxidoreductase [Lactococcus termiticola]GBG97508.1 glutathione reductase [Lactococcus termiticola]